VDPAGGIKRVYYIVDVNSAKSLSMLQFFDSANPSPRKRPRLDLDGENDNDNNEHAGEEHESMPMLYEEEGSEEEQDLNAPDDGDGRISHDLNRRQYEHRPRPPVSAPEPSRVNRRDSLFPATTSKPISARQEGRTSSFQYQECPICKKKLETDNKGLNAHIDFCLSKNVIMEAQTAAQSNPKDFMLSWPSTAKGKRKI